MTTLAWLNLVNRIRREASSFTTPMNDWLENPDYSRGAWLHARYIVMEDFPTHYEMGGPWDTEEGAKAGQHSILLATSFGPLPVERVIYAWLAAPFHGAMLFTDDIWHIGYGAFYRPVGLYHFAAVMDVTSEFYDEPDREPGRLGQYFDAWPGPGTVLPYRAFVGGEWPDPLEVCPDYTYPVGAPIYIFSGASTWMWRDLISARLTDGHGREVEACVQTILDWPKDTPEGRHARNLMFGYGVDFLIPRHPLRRGETYRVDVVVWDGWRKIRIPRSWQFRVADDAVFDPLFPEEISAYTAVQEGTVRRVRHLGLPPEKR